MTSLLVLLYRAVDSLNCHARLARSAPAGRIALPRQLSWVDAAGGALAGCCKSFGSARLVLPSLTLPASDCAALRP